MIYGQGCPRSLDPFYIVIISNGSRLLGHIVHCTDKDELSKYLIISNSLTASKINLIKLTKIIENTYIQILEIFHANLEYIYI